MAVHQNSIDSYFQHINSGAVLTQHDKIIKFLEVCGEHTVRGISEKTGIEKCSVNARVNELVKDGRIEALNNTKCPITRKTVRLLNVYKGQASLF